VGSPRGGWRAEKRKSMVPRSFAGPRRAPLGAPVAVIWRRRPRFRRKCPARDRHAVSGSLSVRGDRRRLAWTLRSSASSWQGLLVDPGVARFAAPSAGLRAGPQGHRTPPRLHDASRERPSVDEVMRSVREAREAGISLWAKAGIQFFVSRFAPDSGRRNDGWVTRVPSFWPRPPTDVFSSRRGPSPKIFARDKSPMPGTKPARRGHRRDSPERPLMPLP
jgi:hypothetical protein